MIRYLIYDTWYMIFDIWYLIFDIDIWYMIFDIWYMIWYIDGRKFDPNWASAAILSDRGWNLAFGRRELSTFQDTEVRFREVALFGTCHPQLLRSVFVCADVDAFCLSCPKFRNIGKTIKNNSAHFCRSNRWRCWHTAEQDFYIAVTPHSQSWIQFCDRPSVQWRGLVWSILEKRCYRIDINITSNGMMCVLAGDNVIEFLWWFSHHNGSDQQLDGPSIFLI